MKGITFRAVYVNPILSGAKVTTIRRPSNRLPVAGERFRLVCRYDRPPFALGTVDHVRDVPAYELTEVEAKADGFASLAELLAALDTLYRLSDMLTLPGIIPLWRVLRFTIDTKS